MGAPYAASSKGRVYAWSGSPHLAANSVSDAPVQLDGDASYDAFGWSMTTGDLNGDGLDDLVVGAPLSDRAWDNAGAVSIYMGAPDFFEGTPTPQTVFVGEVDDHQLGTGLLVHSDINGDGQSDLSWAPFRLGETSSPKADGQWWPLVPSKRGPMKSVPRNSQYRYTARPSKIIWGALPLPPTWMETGWTTCCLVQLTPIPTVMIRAAYTCFGANRPRFSPPRFSSIPRPSVHGSRTTGTA